MSSNDNELYFKKHVLPYVSPRVEQKEKINSAESKMDSGSEFSISCSAPSSSSSSTTLSSASSTESAFDDEKSKWARLLCSWLLQNRKQMQIRVLQVHDKFYIAVVSILYKDDGQEFELVQSLCLSLSAQGFEACFKDLYLNSKIGGTEQENTDGKSAYTLIANVVVNDRFILSTGHPPRHETAWSPFAGTVAKFRTLSECAKYINQLKRTSSNTAFIVSERLDSGGKGEVCSSLQVYDIESLSVHARVFPQHTYRVSVPAAHGVAAADSKEKIESVSEIK